MTEPTAKPHEFHFCYNCGKRTLIPSNHGYIWRNEDGSINSAQCQECGDELTAIMEEMKKLRFDFGSGDIEN